MRLQFSYVVWEVGVECGGNLAKSSSKIWLQRDGRDLVSLYSGVHSLRILNPLLIFGNRKQLQRRRQQGLTLRHGILVELSRTRSIGGWPLAWDEWDWGVLVEWGLPFGILKRQGHTSGKLEGEELIGISIIILIWFLCTLINLIYRYQQVILKPILIPFALKCKRIRPETIVQEDNAPSHSSHYQQEVFDAAQVSRLIWPANSPDLNMIEPC